MPIFSLVIQFHNRGRDARKIIHNLRSTCPFPHEIIAIDDGSKDNTLRTLVKECTGGDEFVFHANNLFEIKTYNRALHLTRGLYIGFFQDDDYAPDSTWCVSAEKILREDCYKNIAILGGRDGLFISPLDIYPDTQNAVRWARKSFLDWEPGRYFHWHGVCNYGLVTQSDLKGRTPPCLVDAVNMAPFIVRRTVALTLGGFDEAFAPFQANDVDFCLRAIKANYKVAVYNSGIIQGFYKGGMRRSKTSRLRTTRQSFRNWQLVYKRHSDLISARSADRKLTVG